MALDPNLLALVLLYRASFGAGDKIARGPISSPKLSVVFRVWGSV